MKKTVTIQQKGFSKSPELRATLGIRVVMAGAESQKAAALLAGKDISKELLIAINSGKNVVLF